MPRTAADVHNAQLGSDLIAQLGVLHGIAARSASNAGHNPKLDEQSCAQLGVVYSMWAEFFESAGRNAQLGEAYLPRRKLGKQ